MRTIALAVGLLVVGCGGSEQAPYVPPPVVDPLLGTWALTTSGGCVDGLTFTAGAQYERDFICTLAAGGIGFDAELGTYVDSGGGITFTAAQATCADAQKVKHFGLSMPSPTQLDIVASDGALLYQKIAPGNGSGVLTFGCWEADGLFYAMPLATLP